MAAFVVITSATCFAILMMGTDTAKRQVVDKVLRGSGGADALAARLVTVALGADEQLDDVTGGRAPRGGTIGRVKQQDAEHGCIAGPVIQHTGERR